MPNLYVAGKLLLDMGEKSRADRLETLKESTPSHDDGDSASMTVEKEVAACLADMRWQEEVHARLAQNCVAKGGHRICIACGGKVSKARLAAVPQTPFCKECQEKLDRNDLPGFEYLAAWRTRNDHSRA